MKDFLGKTIFLGHAVFLILWYGLFLIPESLFPDRITFHFYLTVFVVVQQFVWGALIMPWTKKYRMVCVLTTITQLLRGQSISDPRNYDHSINQELLREVGIKIPHRASTFMTFFVLTLVSIQFFLNR